jgi:hypothetical protein
VVTEKRESYVEERESYVIFFFIISHVRFLANAGMTRVCRKSLLVCIRSCHALHMVGSLTFF